jgi:hypothetical protein
MDTQTFVVDLTQIRDDLLAAAVAGGQTIANLSGESVYVPEEPETESDAAKTQNRALSSVLMAVTIVPLVALTQYTLAVMGQVMQRVFLSMAAIMEAALTAAFSPLLLFSALLTTTMTVRIESIPLVEIFVELPEAPVIDITVG